MKTTAKTSVRLAALSVSIFRHVGLVFEPGWNGYDLTELSYEQREVIGMYLGRFIRVHPDDEQRLSELLANESREEIPEDYKGMTMADLRSLAEDLGIALLPSMRKKADVIQALEQATER